MAGVGPLKAGWQYDPGQRLHAIESSTGSPKCGWQLPLYAWCSCECCAAICQKAVSSSQNAMSLMEPLMLTFGGFMICMLTRFVKHLQEVDN